MTKVIGFEDIKHKIAMALANHRKVNFLLEGPPACAKSQILTALRSVIPEPFSYLAFGSRTSGAGLSDKLFEQKPMLLLVDELEKMRFDVFNLLLGLMTTGEIIETKSKKTRGIQLWTMVIGACNSADKFPAEFMSRFPSRIHFQRYTKEEFIDVCRGVMPQTGCPEDLAAYIGRMVYELKLGDVRSAMGVWDLMEEATQAEANRCIEFNLKYSDNPTSINLRMV